VKFRRTWDRLTGDAISFLSASALLAFGWFLRRREPMPPRDFKSDQHRQPAANRSSDA
jgi:hypothetical protein